MNESGHWYTKAGEPCYEVPKKSGGMRPTNIRDAEELGLLPSVTTILNVVRKPGLDFWKQQQILLASLTLPRGAEETADAYAKRVIEDSQQYSEEAADRGTQIHQRIEQYILNGGTADDPVIERFAEWYEDIELSHIALEQTFGSTIYRYGGRVDFIGTYAPAGVEMPFLADFKTYRGTLKVYPEWSAQLAAYANAIYGIEDAKVFGEKVPNPILATIAIERDTGEVAVHWHDYEHGWAGFKAALDLYFSPLGPGWRLRDATTA